MRRIHAVMFVLVAGSALAASPETPDAQELVRRSVENNERNWKAAPEFSFTEQDTSVSGGRTTRQTYRVTMIDGSPYNQLIATNGEPLPGPAAAAEQKKLERETARRRSESEGARRQRIGRYQRERQQDHALMKEMMKAFDFKVAGHESVNGRDCWVLEATPRAGYSPPSRDTKVLTGMRGRMWIDAREYQWVRVHAEVFRPVAFGLFIAHVRPGTEFTLDQAPAGGGLWMPSRLVTKIHATAFGVWSRNSTEDERYSEYRRTEGNSARAMR
jgi:hypothetical protein